MPIFFCNSTTLRWYLAKTGINRLNGIGRLHNFANRRRIVEKLFDVGKTTFLDSNRVGFISDDSKLDASKESGSLILVGGTNSTITGSAGKNIFFYTNGKGSDTINGAHDGDIVYLSQ